MYFRTTSKRCVAVRDLATALYSVSVRAKTKLRLKTIGNDWKRSCLEAALGESGLRVFGGSGDLAEQRVKACVDMVSFC
jgi:hypothetical protein